LATSLQEEKFIDGFIEPLAQEESQESGWAVLSGFDGTDRLARHAD
jgi:hypothetical protein